MTNFISKTREGARSFSRQASVHELDQTNLPQAMISGVQRIGGVNVDQLQMGVDFPNVQSAIEDIANMYQVRIGQVVTYTDTAITPAGVSMIERLTVTGNSHGTVINVYGLPVKIDVGDNQATVTTKIVAELTKYKEAGIAFKTITLVGGVNNQIDVEFIDTVNHENQLSVMNGITVSGVTSTQAIAGYGSWSLVGTQDVVNSGITTQLVYYKRIA